MRFARGPILARAEAANLDGRWHRANVESELCLGTWQKILRSGEILLRGGQLFPELTPARLTGVTLGGSFCKLGGIYVGFQMEISAHGQRLVTTPVESIGILP
jgi:hypothetical protein